MPTSTISSVNFSSLRAGMEGLRRELQLRLAFNAAAAGARVVQKRAVEIASTIPSGAVPGLRETGSLIRNIAIARQKAINGTYFPYHIGVRHGTVKQKKGGDDPYYFWFLEFGFTSKSGKKFQFPFLTPALAQSVATSIAAVHASLEKGIIKQQDKFKGGA